MGACSSQSTNDTCLVERVQVISNRNGTWLQLLVIGHTCFSIFMGLCLRVGRHSTSNNLQPNDIPRPCYIGNMMNLFGSREPMRVIDWINPSLSTLGSSFYQRHSDKNSPLFCLCISLLPREGPPMRWYHPLWCTEILHRPARYRQNTCAYR